jgi:hypothetical protein
MQLNVVADAPTESASRVINDFKIHVD